MNSYLETKIITPRNAELVSSNEPEQSVLVEPRELAQKLYEMIVSRGRFRGYDSVKNKITDIRDVIQSDSREMTLEEIVFDYPKYPDNTHSVSLFAKGGAGKTHQFINLIRIILFGDKVTTESEVIQLKYPEIIPYYVELNDITQVTGKNVILQALAFKLNIQYSVLTQILHNAGTKAILFCDGMNEVTDAKLRDIIAGHICEIREEYHTRIILSSRVDHTSLFNSLGKGTNQVFVKAEIKELDEYQINQYFKDVGLSIRFRDVPMLTRKLLETAQGLSMYASMLQDDEDKVHDFKNLGILLQSYCYRILKIDRKTCKRSDLAFEDILSSAAYHMVLQGKFQLFGHELKNLIGEKEYNNLINDEKAAMIFSDHGKRLNKEPCKCQ